MYSAETLRPLGLPVIEAEFSSGQICHSMSHIHTRGNLLAISCEDVKDRPGNLGYTTKLWNWKTQEVILSVSLMLQVFFIQLVKLKQDLCGILTARGL